MSKFEAIIPLSGLQETLLVHHQIAEHDQGQLHVQFVIEGRLDKTRLQMAWDAVVAGTPALRTTIHWEKTDKPVQIVHHPRTMPLLFLDVEDPEQLTDKIAELEAKDVSQGYELSKRDVETVRVISASEVNHIVHWHCHHILLDGWSTAHILRDLHTAYHDVKSYSAGSRRPAMRDYLLWRKLHRESYILPRELDGLVLKTTRLFGRDRVRESAGQTVISQVNLKIDQSTSEAIADVARKMAVSVNTLYQASWSLLLMGWSGQDEVVHGTTVSGRDIAMPGITDLVGMLTNVVPVIARSQDENMSNWLEVYQASLSETMAAGQTPLPDQQRAWGRTGKELLLQSLFTYENFPWQDLSGRDIAIRDFQGGLTSTFPLTGILAPRDEAHELKILYDTHFIPANEAKQLCSDYLSVLQGVLSGAQKEYIISNVSPRKSPAPAVSTTNAPIDRQIVLPESKMELDLAHIWARVLQRPRISVDADFFSLGGTSLQALRIFTAIESELGHKILPAKLLEYRSIRALANFITRDSSAESWSAVVPLSIQGEGAPLFCIHAGGAHVFAYRELAEIMSDERPVYGIQSYGLDGTSMHNQSIDSMARAYLREILTIVPEGPILVLGYCFSSAIVYEMARIVREEYGLEIHIIVVDSGPGITFGRPDEQKQSKISKWISIIRRGEWLRVRDMLLVKWFALRGKLFSQVESQQMKDFRRTEAALEIVYNKYDWPQQDLDIHLIRSREFAQRSDKDLHVSEWKSLSGDRVDLHVVPGRHVNLFKAPLVARLAETISSILAQQIR